MEVTVSTEQARVPVRVFHIVGDIDTSSAEQLQTLARQEIDHGARYLVLDLEHVPYISSWGIRAISQIFTWLREAANDEDENWVSKSVREGTYASRHLKLTCAAPRVQKVLGETGLDMYVPVAESVQKAVAAF